MNAIFISLKSNEDIERYFSEVDDDDDDNDNENENATLNARSKTNPNFSMKTTEEQQQQQPSTTLPQNEDNVSSEPFLNVSKPSSSNDQSEEVNPNPELSRDFMNKLFGPIKPGSIRGSIFNLVILSLGSGCLSLPRYISKTSISLGLAMVVVIGLLVWWALTLMSKVCAKEGIYIYSNLIKKVYGKSLALVYDIVVILYTFGVLILNQTIIFTLLGEAIYNLFFYWKFSSNEEFLEKSFWAYPYVKYVVPYVIGLGIIFPLCLIKDVSKLRIASLIGVVVLISIILLLIIEAPFYFKHYLDYIYKKDDASTHLNIFHIERGFDNTLTFFELCSSMFYAYVTTIGAVPIFNSLQNRVYRRIQKVVRRTIIFDIGLFLVIVTIGYLTCPIGTPALIIERNSIHKDQADVPMSIARLALVLTILMKLPSNYNSLRITLFNMIWKTTEITPGKNIIVTVSVLTFCCTVSVLYSEISGYIKLIGGICSSVVGFIIPALLYTKTNGYGRFDKRNVGIMTVFVVLTAIGFISAGRTLYNIITGK